MSKQEIDCRANVVVCFAVCESVVFAARLNTEGHKVIVIGQRLSSGRGHSVSQSGQEVSFMFRQKTSAGL